MLEVAIVGGILCSMFYHSVAFRRNCTVTCSKLDETTPLLIKPPCLKETVSANSHIYNAPYFGAREFASSAVCTINSLHFSALSTQALCSDPDKALKW